MLIKTKRKSNVTRLATQTEKVGRFRKAIRVGREREFIIFILNFNSKQKMKKKIFLLPCIAAFAIATFVGAKTLRSNASESNSLLMANVEALSMREFTNLGDCYSVDYESPDQSTFQKKCPPGTTDNRIDDCPKDVDIFCKGPSGKCKL